METRRRGACLAWEGEETPEAKRRRTNGSLLAVVVPGGTGAFEDLPDELVVSIIAALAASANSPADLVATMLTCKRFRELGQDKQVLAVASAGCIAVRAKCWSDDAHRFLSRCSGAGNIDALYLLGMIKFYCVGSRRSGLELILQAAMRGHAEALYSLAIIQFNGSGHNKADRKLQAGAQLCARAAQCGHTDAIRELGHCFSDGYGIPKSVSRGRRLLVKANLLEMRTAFRGHPAVEAALSLRGKESPEVPLPTCLLSDFGCDDAASPSRSAHPANSFLAEWFTARLVRRSAAGRYALRLCSQPACGRPETRQNEFRRCSVCGLVIYCSRGCQALHWRAGHKKECIPVIQRLAAANAIANVGVALNANVGVALNANVGVALHANINGVAVGANVNTGGAAAAPVAGDGHPDAAAVIVQMPMQ